MKKTRVDVVILNWNTLDDTLLCLTSLRKVYSKGIQMEMIVVDNASSDNSVETFQKRFPQVKIIPLSENKGFTGGNAVGIEKALENGAEYVWILNNDTIVDPHALSELVDAFNDPSVGIAGSKIYFMKGQEFHHDRYKERERGKVLWYAGGKVDWENVYASHRGVDEVDRGQYDEIQETDFVTGCSLMISRRCLETVGMFNDKYFVYLEDLDLSMRAKRAGFKVMYMPTSLVWHKNAGSTSRPGNLLHQYYMTRNRLLFGLTYASARTKFALLREAFHFATQGNTAQKKAIIDAALGRWGKQWSFP